MIQKDDILSYLRENQPTLKKQFHLTKIGLFGSFARGDQTETSDIDLLIELEENTPDIFELKQALKRLIYQQFRRDVAIARIKYLKPYAKSHILKEAIFVDDLSPS